MNFANLMVVALLTYFIGYTIHLIGSKKYREKVKEDNKILRIMRKVPIKTVEEQKKFIDIKYPKSRKWDVMDYIKLTFSVLLFAMIFMVINYIFNKYGISIRLWQALVFIIIFPLVYNIIMVFFGLEKDSLLNYFGVKIGGKK